MKNNVLTIKQGCFNCLRHEKEGCNLTYSDGRPIDFMEIRTNDKTGEKYRTGCCCGNYKVGSNGRETVIFT